MAAAEATFLLNGDAIPADAVVVRYEAHEELSRPFHVDVEFWTEDAAFDAASLLRKPALLEIIDEVSESRFFHGVCDEVEFVDADEGGRLRFRIRLVSFLAALAHREGCRIFQDQPPIEVVKTIFEEAGIPADKVEWVLYNDYGERAYITQYRESELNFVERLFEDEGIFYFFRHTPDGHKLVISDDSAVFQEDPDAANVILGLAQGLGIDGVVKPVEQFARTRSLRTTNVILLDYDFEKPQTNPSGVQKADDAINLPYFEFPGGFIEAGDGKRRAQARMRSLRRDADVCSGKSRAIGLRVGVPFAVEGADQAACNGLFVVTSLTSRGEQIPDRDDVNFAHKNAFTAIPKGAPWAPERRAKRPRIRGIQTAIVTGHTNTEETIHCDKYARIKVRFHWDRVGQFDDKSSCWLRTTQLNTGGSVILPRVGWEVSVAFFDGDPDRPFVLGRLYNGERAVPYALPGAKAAGSLKSNSSPGGAGHNELKMSDTASSQGLGITAQKDLNIAIGHDKTEKIGVDETHNVTVNMSRQVGSNEKIEVGANQNIDVGDLHTQKIKGKQSITVGANETANAESNLVENIGGSRTYTVGANYTLISNGIELEAAKGMKRNVGAAHVVATPDAILHNIGGSYTESVGAVKIVVAKGIVAESVGSMKTQTTAAAEIHLVKGNFQVQAPLVTEMIGGLHYQDVAGDYTVKAPMITLLGATGTFTGGGTALKLGGGPVVMKGSKIAIKAANIIKMGASLKMGSG